MEYKKPVLLVPLVNTMLLVAIVLVLPLLIPILALFQVHRQIVAHLLAAKYGSSFRGLLEGSDVVWAAQTRSSKAMANVLLLFEKPARATLGSDELLEIFRNRLKRHQSDEAYQKMFWERRFQWGYYFWVEQGLPLWADRYVKELDALPGHGCLSRKQLCTLIGSISSRDCNGTSWELLVGSQPLRSQAESGVMLHPVVFRYHHSIADGIAIFRLFCKDFLDSTGTSEQHVWNPDAVHTSTSMKRFITWRNILQMAFRSPRFLINEILLKREHSPFFGTEPSGEKIVCWAGADSEHVKGTTPVINVIKNIKRSLDGSSFTDVFLTAFAMSLRAYCTRKGVPVPPSVTIGLMQRFQRESKVIQLRNLSTAVFKTLPVAELPVGASSVATSAELRSQINAVKGSKEAVQASADALLTHLSVSYLPELLPVPIVRALFARSKFTIALSNIPAFGDSVSVENYILKEATFWVPNIERNMFGLTILTMDGRLQLGAIADRRIISSERELECLLCDTLQELRNFGEILHKNQLVL